MRIQINTFRLGLALAEKGLNVKKLSALSCISQTTLSAINAGKGCKPDIVYRIAKVLEKDPEYLIGFDKTADRSSNC